jgi:hypothetical protein
MHSAAEDFDECAFSGSVLAEESMNLALIGLEIDLD